MNRALRAVGGGVVGTVVMTFFLLILDTQARGAVSVSSVIARFVGVPGRPLLALLLFAAVLLLGWPLVFAVVERSLPGGSDSASRGVVFAAVIWVAFVVVGRGDVSGPILVIYVGFSLIAHLAYGFTLGAVYGRLGR